MNVFCFFLFRFFLVCAFDKSFLLQHIDGRIATLFCMHTGVFTEFEDYRRMMLSRFIEFKSKFLEIQFTSTLIRYNHAWSSYLPLMHRNASPTFAGARRPASCRNPEEAPKSTSVCLSLLVTAFCHKLHLCRKLRLIALPVSPGEKPKATRVS